MNICVKSIPKSFIHRITNKEDLYILFFIIKNLLSFIKLKRSSISFKGESIWDIPYITNIRLIEMDCKNLYLLNLMTNLNKLDLWNLIYNDNSKICIKHDTIQHLSIDGNPAIEVESLNLFLPNCSTLYLSMIWLDNTKLEFDQTNLPQVKKLNIHYTNIVEFKIQNNDSLTDLYLANNEYLNEISIESQSLKFLSLKNIAKFLNFNPIKLENLQELNCDDNLQLISSTGYQFLKIFNPNLKQSSSLTNKLF